MSEEATKPVILRQWFGLDDVAVRRFWDRKTAAWVAFYALSTANRQGHCYMARAIDTQTDTTFLMIQHQPDGCVPMLAEGEHCTGCGCSEDDPCGECGDPCGWAGPNLCTACAAKDARPQLDLTKETK